MADFPNAALELGEASGVDASIVDSIVYNLMNNPSPDIAVPEQYRKPVEEAIANYKDANPGKQPSETTSGDITKITKDAFKRYQATVQDQAAVETRVAGNIRSLLSEEVSAINRKGEAEAVAATQLGGIELQRAAAAKEASSAYGLDMTKPENIVAAAGADTQRSFFKLQRQLAKRSELAALTPLDGPLDFIAAPLKLKFQEPAIKAEKERFDQLNKITQEAQQRTLTQDSINNQNLGTTTAAAVSAAAEKARAGATVLSTRAAIEAEKTY